MAAGNSTGIGSGANAARVEVENNSVGCDPRMCAAQGLGDEFMHGGSTIGSNMSSGGGGAITFAAILLAIFGNDAPKVPNNTGGDQIADSGPTNTGGNQLPVQQTNHTGNSNGQVDTGPNHTGGNQTAEQLSSNTGNTEDAPNLPTHYESAGQDNGAEKPTNIKVADDKFLKNNGVDAHRIKKDFLGAKAEIKLYDIYVDKNSEQLWIVRKGGKGEGIKPVNTLISRINHG